MFKKREKKLARFAYILKIYKLLHSIINKHKKWQSFDKHLYIFLNK